MNHIFEKLKQRPRFCPFCDYLVIRGKRFLVWNCYNHGDIVVELQYETMFYEIVLYVYLKNLKNYKDMNIILSEDLMEIASYKDCISIKLPFDKSLTPENFEERTKFYLMFQ
jgi:hypothetical protein